MSARQSLLNGVFWWMKPKTKPIDRRETPLLFSCQYLMQYHNCLYFMNTFFSYESENWEFARKPKIIAVAKCHSNNSVEIDPLFLLNSFYLFWMNVECELNGTQWRYHYFAADFIIGWYIVALVLSFSQCNFSRTIRTDFFRESSSLRLNNVQWPNIPKNSAISIQIPFLNVTYSS